ncbi:MAG TPA: PQQ-binding-like beta-propeller repeat protein [Gemmataceae bacterium]|nr:PQQ-binding-like beta-propeller repeat protein [Gemmataceae bacterium]
MRPTLAILCVFCALPTSVHAENWPDWRGPNHDGVSHETGLATKWSDKENVAWTLKMPGKAGSTPIVWGNQIFLTSAEGIEPKRTESPKKGRKDGRNDSPPTDLILVSISADGKELWRRKLAKAGRGAIRNDEGNEASASPSTDGKHVYCFVSTGDLTCFDFAGNEVWHRDIQKDYGKFSIQHGMHQSPILYGDRLYVALIHNNGHWLIALDKATGKEIWKVKRESDARGESREAYASPILWKNGPDTQIVVLGADYATGHRLEDGKEDWRLGGLNPKGPRYSSALRIIATPAPSPEGLVVPTARGGLIVALRPGVKGDVAAGSPFEFWRKTRGAPDVPTPVVHEGIVYAPREDGGIIQCWDLKTGAENYVDRIHSDRYRGSPVYGDGKVYLTARDGTFTVLEAGPKFKVLATNTLPDHFTSSPAISGGTIYLRGFETLYAIRNR